MAQNLKNILSFICITFLFLGLLSLSACSKTPNWRSQVIGTPYYEARKTIMNEGWIPAAEERTDLDQKYNQPHFYYDAGYTEVLACSGTSMGYCTFKFYNEKGKYLRVTTKGGDYERNDDHPPTVIYVGLSEDFD